MASAQQHQLGGMQDPKREVLAHYFSLSSVLQRVTKTANQRAAEQNARSPTANVALADINAIGKYLSSQLEPIYYNERRQPDSTIAPRTFLIPDLLEMILEHTSFIDILHMSMTCKGIRNAIYASAKSLVKLHLKPTKELQTTYGSFFSPLGSEFQSYIYLYDGYKLTFETERMAPDRHLYYSEIDSDSDFSDSELDAGPDMQPKKFCIWIKKVSKKRSRIPRIGLSWKQMVICQSPIRDMYVKPRCSCCVSDHDDDWRPFISKKGITLGGIVGEAKRIMDKGCMLCYNTKKADLDLEQEDSECEKMSPSEVEFELENPIDEVVFRATIPA